MGFDVVHLLRCKPRLTKGRLNHLLLSFSVRSGEAVGAPILVDGTTPNHGVYRVSLGDRLGEGLQHHRPGPLRAHKSVCRRIKGLAATFRGEGGELAETNGEFGAQNQVNPARDRHR